MKESEFRFNGIVLHYININNNNNHILKLMLLKLLKCIIVETVISLFDYVLDTGYLIYTTSYIPRCVITI